MVGGGGGGGMDGITLGGGLPIVVGVAAMKCAGLKKPKRRDEDSWQRTFPTRIRGTRIVRFTIPGG